MTHASAAYRNLACACARARACPTCAPVGNNIITFIAEPPPSSHLPEDPRWTWDIVSTGGIIARLNTGDTAIIDSVKWSRIAGTDLLQTWERQFNRPYKAVKGRLLARQTICRIEYLIKRMKSVYRCLRNFLRRLYIRRFNVQLKRLLYQIKFNCENWKIWYICAYVLHSKTKIYLRIYFFFSLFDALHDQIMFHLIFIAKHKFY